MYRNDMKDVQMFLEARHKGHYKVYNLCSERSYDIGKFQNRAMRFPFDDHACPAFDRMTVFLEDVHQWLNADPENIVVIHCKAGKGRTGVTIATYLLYCGMWKHAAQALRYVRCGGTHAHGARPLTLHVVQLLRVRAHVQQQRRDDPEPAPMGLLLRGVHGAAEGRQAAARAGPDAPHEDRLQRRRASVRRHPDQL